MDFIHKVFDPSLPRLGPGSDASTLKALRALGLAKRNEDADRKILDLGCGNGAQTMSLAKHLNGSILAVDNHQPYLDELRRRAQAAGQGHRITTRLADMADTGLESESFDLVWSESALFVVGFEAGLRICRSMARPGGLLGASELVWLHDSPPDECREFFGEIYPPMALVDDNLAVIESCGLELVDYFTMPASDWLESFYVPVEKWVDLLEAQPSDDQAWKGMLAGTRREIDIYRRFSDYYGYEFFVMRRA